LDENPGGANRASALAFRLKLLVAAGLAPQLAACACCGEREHLVGFSGAAGGVVCSACWPSESPAETRTAGAFPLEEGAYEFMTEALGRPLHEAPDSEERALGQVERAVSETLEHHAHVRLMPATDRRSIPRLSPR
ncbi:MAG TPA: DNA repair protein RecO C-terminal domain-containing protein, partial [Solirubrobacteraceae bacterium]